MHAALAHGISNSCPHKQIWPPSFNQLPSFPSKECGRVEGPLYNYADPSNLVIVNAYTQKSVRTQSRNDEGPILVGKGNNVTTFEEASDLFRSIDEKMVRPHFALYAPVEYANPAERRAMQTKLLEPILKCLEGFSNGK